MMTRRHKKVRGGKVDALSQLNMPSPETQAIERQDKFEEQYRPPKQSSLPSSSTGVVDYLVSVIDTLKQPVVKQAITTGLKEIVEDAKPAMNKLAEDMVSLGANVAEDVAGPLIGIPRTLENVASLAETGIDLTKKTVDDVSKIKEEIEQTGHKMTDQISQTGQKLSDTVAQTGQQLTNQVSNQVSNQINQATQAAHNTLNDAVTQPIKDLKRKQEDAFERSKESMRQIAGGRKLTIKRVTRKQRGGKTRKRISMFERIHSYF